MISGERRLAVGQTDACFGVAKQRGFRTGKQKTFGQSGESAGGGQRQVHGSRTDEIRSRPTGVYKIRLVSRAVRIKNVLVLFMTTLSLGLYKKVFFTVTNFGFHLTPSLYFVGKALKVLGFESVTLAFSLILSVTNNLIFLRSVLDMV